MSGHTPGPWSESPFGDVTAGVDERGLDIVVGAAGQASPLRSEAYRSIRGKDVAKSNNRMFAASPDLLAACKALVGSVTQETERGRVYALSELSSAVDAAKAAISKAERP